MIAETSFRQGLDDCDGGRLGMLLAAGSDPEYPLGRLRFPSLTKPAEPLKLTEFHYGFSENGSTVQRFEARIRFKAFAFLSGEVSVSDAASPLPPSASTSV